MEKKTILITGATSGIGKATATLFAARGERLILCGRRQERLETLQNEFQCESHAAEAAERDRVATIKPRHLDRALLNMKPAEGEEDDENAPEVSAADDFVASQAGGLVTPTALLSMAKSIARMGVTKDALDELLFLYAEVLEDLEEDIRNHAQLGSNPVQFIESINAMRGMMTLGWMRSKLTRAAEHARGRGAKVIELQDIIDSQSYASE